MFLHQSATKLVHFSRKSVQKITVMADYAPFVKIADSLLQHIFGTHVKMIRRLVESGNSPLQQQFYHGKPGTLSTAEHLHLFIRSLTAEHEST